MKKKTMIVNKGQMDQVRVNVTAKVNHSAIRKETRDGRNVIIVPSATLPDNVIMNGILYTPEEIEKGYRTLERTPAPLGHPVVNGKLVSASDPEGLNRTWIGAWNENVRREKGRVFLDKVIDVEIANAVPKGREVLAAIEAGTQLNTSTGLLCNIETVNDGDGYQSIARNIYFDHDAILLGEKGAATPEQGVGMLVNSQGETVEVKVINSYLSEAEQEIDWAGQRLLRAIEQGRVASTWTAIKHKVIEMISSPAAPINNSEDTEMTIDPKEFAEVQASLAALSASVANIADTVKLAVNEATKPLIDNLNEAKQAEEARAAAEKTELVGKVVKANKLSQSVAEQLTVNALRELAATITPGKADGINGAFQANAEAGDYVPKDYDLNAHLDADK